MIVTRFPSTGEGGHGHHTASAILAEEAFKAAGDPSRFPEQLDTLTPWQPKRLLWNVFRFGGDAPRKDVPGQITADLGAYNALLGRSYTEIAALSRNMHKSQGFGSAERRGTWLNDFKNIAGAPAEKDLFEGIDLSWKRIGARGEEIGKILRKGKRDSLDRPGGLGPQLVEAWALLGQWRMRRASRPIHLLRNLRFRFSLRNRQQAESTGPKQMDPLLARKRRDIADAIRACLGLWVEAVASEPSAAPGASVKVATMILNRSSRPATLESVSVTYAGGAGRGRRPRAERAAAPRDLADAPRRHRHDAAVLAQGAAREGPLHGDRPGAHRPAGEPAAARRALHGARRRSRDPVRGARRLPPHGSRQGRDVPAVRHHAARDGHVRREGLRVRDRETEESARHAHERRRRLGRPAPEDGGGFSASPAEVPFTFTARGEEKPVTFTVTPPAGASAATLTAEAVVNGKVHSRGLVRVDYPHIPPQTLFPPAEAKVLRLDVKAPQAPVGYVMGSGDEVPDALRQMGYTVTLLSDDELENGDLSRYAAIVTGIRAYNTRPRLKLAEARLVDYVEKGGTLVAQYNTLGDLVTEQLGPYPFKISRDRVTVEEAPVKFLNPASSLLAFPNRLTAADFDGWVQERGLYFPGTWDPRYETVIETHDPGEGEKPGGLLFARHGKGAFVYTGYAFFRQLPAGVPGAYRLFVNLVSAGAGARLRTTAPSPPDALRVRSLRFP